jgi:hypothetical protein
MNDPMTAFLPDNLSDCDGDANSDKRSRERTPVVADVFVTPLDDEMEPLRNPFRGRTKDISTSGASFFHATPFHSKFVLLTITMASTDHLNLLFRVVRTNEVRAGLYFTAGIFEKRLHHTH